MKTNLAQQIEEMEEKLGRQTLALASYREQFQKLDDHKSERDLYRELSTIFACTSNFDDMLKQTLDALTVHLKAHYYGIFLIDNKNENFVLLHGKGYVAEKFPTIPYTGSLMGDCLFRKQIIWESNVNACNSLVNLTQNPMEYNILCAPITLLGIDAGVIRIANIDPATSEKARSILATVMQLLCPTLERLKLQSQNTWALRSLEASFAIARLLENTLSKQDILKRICSEVPHLFDCAGCVLAMKDKDGIIKQVLSWPDNFVITGNQTSGAIYLRNLIQAYPSGNCNITNIQRDDRKWAWPNAKVKSLCMAPIRLHNTIEGVLISLSPSDVTYNTAHTNLIGIVASQTSMTLERALYFQKQEDLARCDGLTGLFNHRIFQETVREEINRLQRYPHPLTLVMLDIDHFKKCNDTYGHPIGDEVIKMVSRTIKTMIRTTDRGFRYGGEEFTILLPETPVTNGALLAERLRLKVQEDRSVKNLCNTISIGIVGLLPMETAESFIKRADTCLYTAKKNGRNQVVAG